MEPLIRSNRNKTYLLVFFMLFLLTGSGFAIGMQTDELDGGLVGVIIGFAIWFVLAIIAHFQGNNILLAFAGAKQVSNESAPQLHNVVEEMVIASGLGVKPAVYLIEDESPNAFATGRTPKNSAIAVTSGLVKILNRDELQGVIAHELAHISNRDTRLMMAVSTMLGSIVILAELGKNIFRFSFHSKGSRDRKSKGIPIFQILALVFLILSPIFAQLTYFAISRRREYLADACAAKFTRYPEGLASALEKISVNAIPMQRVNRVTAPHFIVNPLKAKKLQDHVSDLSSTHPDTAERVKILRSLGNSQNINFTQYNDAYKSVTGKKGIVPKSLI